MKLAEITDLIGFMEKSEPLRLIFDSLASETALTMAGISFFLPARKQERRRKRLWK